MHARHPVNAPGLMFESWKVGVWGPTRALSGVLGQCPGGSQGAFGPSTWRDQHKFRTHLNIAFSKKKKKKGGWGVGWEQHQAPDSLKSSIHKSFFTLYCNHGSTRGVLVHISAWRLRCVCSVVWYWVKFLPILLLPSSLSYEWVPDVSSGKVVIHLRYRQSQYVSHSSHPLAQMVLGVSTGLMNSHGSGEEFIFYTGSTYPDYCLITWWQPHISHPGLSEILEVLQPLVYKHHVSINAMAL